MLKLVLFVLPLGLDTFAVSAALGASGARKRERLRISLLLSGFEMAMPIVGLLLGRGLGSALGNAAEYVATVVLGAVGFWMLVTEEKGETGQVAELSKRRGLHSSRSASASASTSWQSVSRLASSASRSGSP